MDEIGHNGTSGSEPTELDVTERPVQARRPEIEADLAVLVEIAGELDGIEAALGRIDRGAYGQCATCGVPIDAAVLEADPLVVACHVHR